jgi:hypothetical protein
LRYSVSQAASSVAMLRRHGRTPSDIEVLDAYRDLATAKIEQCIRELDTRGLPLDAERAEYLKGLLAERTAAVEVSR